MRTLSLLILSFMAISLGARTINGFVYEQKSGEPIAYASVYVKSIQTGTLTNKEGFFVLPNLADGQQDLAFSHLGYKQKITKIMVKPGVKTLKIELERQAVELAAVEVKARNFEDEFEAPEIKIGHIRQNTADIQAVSQIGDADVFRALQMQPGVVPISDFSSGLYVRGGTPDQNLILLDGIDVYNPSHFGGIFSTFNTDAIENVELYKGGYKAQFGGRLSSVMDAYNLDGNRKEHHGVARLSLISSSATVQGPWHMGGQQGSYMASFRRTYLETMQGLIPALPDYYFYDGHAKANWDLSMEDRLQFSTYFGQDKLSMDLGVQMDIDWGNQTICTQWKHLFTDKMFSQFLLAGSHYGSYFSQKSDSGQGMDRDNDIYDYTLRGLFNWVPTDNHHVDFGFDAKVNDIYFVLKAHDMDVDPLRLPNVKIRSITSDVWMQDSWELDAFWTIQPGIRLTHFYCWPINVDQIDKAEHLKVSPRLAVRYNTGAYSNVYASYGRYYQYLTSANLGMSTPFDLWFPIEGSVKPGKSDHFILGSSTQLNQDFALDAEAYYKQYENLTELRPEVDYEWNNNTGVLADIFNMGDGFSYGVDLQLRNDWHGLSGFIGYTYGITKRTIDNTNLDPDTNKPQEYYARHDRTHQLNLVENLNASETWDWHMWGSDISFGLTTTYSSGQPYYKPEQVYFDGGELISVYSYKDKFRLPAYFRADLAVRFKWFMKGWNIEPYMQVINVTNNNNVWSRAYSYSIDDDLNSQTFGKISIEEHDTYQFPLLPFIGVNVDW